MKPIFFISAFSIVSMTLASCGNVRHELPEQIGINEVLTSTGVGFYMEGCANVVYRLSEETMMALRREGISFFSGMAPPRNQNRDNPYSEWRATPIPDPQENHILAVSAIGGCQARAGNFYTREINDALRMPGSYYALTRNGEGMMVVVPQSGIATFLYLG